MVGVEHENTIQRPLDHGVDHVFLAGCREHHVQEIACVAQVVLGVHVRLSHAVLVRHGHQGRHLGDQTDRRDFTVFRVVDVGAVVVEGRQGAHQTGHDGHRMGIATEATQEELHLLVHHGVIAHALDERCLGGNIWQVAVQQQVASFHEIAVGSQLLDGVTTVQQLAFVAVNVGDGRLA
jgi:hypothetical protein